MLRSSLAATAALLTLFAADATATTYCPRPLHRATRLIVVTVPDMKSVQATLHTFERRSPGDATWFRAGPPEPAVVGSAGIGWAQTFSHLAKKDEPIKTEGDNRTPAGIFRMSAPFGLKARPVKGFMKLAPGKSFCVRDPASIYYGKIIDKALVRSAKSEDMATVPTLREGIFVDYPARRAAKNGSCLFLHVWENDVTGTEGRVAVAEDRVSVLQDWMGQGFTAIAIVTEETAKRFSHCLPINAKSNRYDQPAMAPMPNPRRDRQQRAEIAPRPGHAAAP